MLHLKHENILFHSLSFINYFYIQIILVAVLYWYWIEIRSRYMSIYLEPCALNDACTELIIVHCNIVITVSMCYWLLL